MLLQWGSESGRCSVPFLAGEESLQTAVLASKLPVEGSGKVPHLALPALEAGR